MENKREQLIKWLNDAHALEEEIVKILEKQAEDLDGEDKQEVQRHIETTKKQANQVEQLIQNMGGEVSKLKEGGANLMGMMSGFMGSMAKDKKVKYAIVDHATEHFEMASYLSLMAAAKELGEEEVVKVCEEIIKEEEEMAKILKEKIPSVTIKFLNQLE